MSHVHAHDGAESKGQVKDLPNFQLFLDIKCFQFKNKCTNCQICTI